MFSKLSKEQLEKLVLYTTGINAILLEALANSSVPHMPEMPEAPWELEIIGQDKDMVILIAGVDAIRELNKSRTEPEMNLDALCGEWAGGKNRPILHIFKAEPGYMAAIGKPDKKTGIQDCDLIRRINGRLEFLSPDGYAYLYYDADRDILKMWPGGEYVRIPESKK